MTELSDELISKIVKPGRYPDRGRGSVPGLAFQLSRAGGRSWIFRYKWARRDRMLGLGRYSAAVGLSEARRRAKKALSDVWGGTDPIAVKKEKSVKRTTFGQAAEGYIKANEAGWKDPKSPGAWRSTLKTYAYPKLEHLAVVDINVSHVLSVLRPIWLDITVTAKRLQMRIEKVLDYGDHGDNPARWAKLKHKLPAPTKVAKVTHHPALPFDDLPEFVGLVTKQDGTAALALQFLILTAARTGEVIGARWSEINLTEKLWVIPLERMKAGRQHRVPLSDRAIKLLKSLPREDGNDFVFIGPRQGAPLSNMALLALLRRMGRSDIVVHGFRTSFRSWCAARTNYPREVAEAALAHTIRNKVEAVYQQDDLIEKRRLLMSEWARFSFTPRKGGGEVVPLRKAAQ